MRILAHLFAVSMFALCSASLAQVISVDQVKIRTSGAQAKGSKLQFYSALVSVPVDGLSVLLGSGYDAVTGEIIPNVCVDQPKPANDLEVGFDHLSIADHYEYINTVTDMAGQQSSSGSGGGFTFAYKLVSLGADVSDSTSDYFNNFDAFARIYTRYITKSKERFNGTWAKGYQTEALATNKSKFVEHCGTHYVSKAYWGSLIDQTLRFKLNESSRDAASKASLSVGIGQIFGIHGDNQQAEQSVSSMSTLKVVGTSKGIPLPPIATPSSSSPAASSPIAAAVKFAREDYAGLVLASKPENAQLLFIEVQPYKRLNAPGSDKVPGIPLELMAKLQSKLGLYDELLSNILTMRLVRGFTQTQFNVFYKGSAADLATLSDQADQLQVSFIKAVQDCEQLIAKSSGSSTDPQQLCSAGLDVLTRAKVSAVSLVPSGS
jgi:hypothetical protein